MVAQEHRRKHCNKAVAVKLGAVGQNGTRTVYVGVKDNSQISL